MRLATVSLLIALLTTGCLHPGHGRAGNRALIAVGSTLAAGAIVKAQFAEEDQGSFVSMTPVFESGVLVTMFALGVGTAATGVIGLSMPPPPPAGE